MEPRHPTDIDISENQLMKLSGQLLETLLTDCTTKGHLIWATADYSHLGSGYAYSDHITVEAITGKNGHLIRPRVSKTTEERRKRARDKAEVFTPSPLCNQQINLADERWFGHASPFNEAQENSWSTKEEPIAFSQEKGWQEYLTRTVLEICCGEAPYLTSRYDTTTGQYIPPRRRIGLFDRKLRVLGEQQLSDAEWIHWGFRALKSCYGYEWQGDNLLLARENMLSTFSDFYRERFTREAPTELLMQAAEIISWNLWQMDGLKGVIPDTCSQKSKVIHDLFGQHREVITTPCPGCENNDDFCHNGTYCLLMDWETGKTIRFVDLS